VYDPKNKWIHVYIYTKRWWYLHTHTSGDHILLADGVYDPTRAFCDRFLRKFNVACTYFDPICTADELAALFQPNTKVASMYMHVWIDVHNFVNLFIHRRHDIFCTCACIYYCTCIHAYLKLCWMCVDACCMPCWMCIYDVCTHVVCRHAYITVYVVYAVYMVYYCIRGIVP